MCRRNELVSFYKYGFHKGFYNDGDDPTKALYHIKYTDFFEPHEDVYFPFDDAHDLLCGSCHHFALSLKAVLNYDPYIIEGIDKADFHAFCKAYKNSQCYYIDARGATTSFDEFMAIARNFVTGEYIIRPIDVNDIAKWKKGFCYEDEAYAFAEAFIKEYRECYEI